MDRPSSVKAGVAALLAIATLHAMPPSLDEVLDRMRVYLVDYESKIEGLVADEEYEQRISRTSSYGGGVVARRKLSSELFLVRLPDGHPWYGVRDPLRMDGKPLTGDRVGPLLREGTEDAYKRAVRIAHDNAKYNIGNIYRTINLPLPALEMLQPNHRQRFRFSALAEARAGGRRTWRFEFEEVSRPSIVSSGLNDDVLANGTAWIDQDSGAVMRTELRLGGADQVMNVPTVIVVDYAADARVGLIVPVEMRETYTFPNQVLHGKATYRNYRRFETSARLVPDR